jgi:site-specific DNA-methyltransferase (adenine-specific)
MKTLHKIIIGDSRQIKDVSDESVHLIITSPPYWQLKDYGNGKQIGFNDTYGNILIISFGMEPMSKDFT